MKEELKKNKDRMRMHYRGMNGRLVLLTDTKISIGQNFTIFVNVVYILYAFRLIYIYIRDEKQKQWHRYNIQLVPAINWYVF